MVEILSYKIHLFNDVVKVVIMLLVSDFDFRIKNGRSKSMNAERIKENMLRAIILGLLKSINDN